MGRSDFLRMGASVLVMGEVCSLRVHRVVS